MNSDDAPYLNWDDIPSALDESGVVGFSIRCNGKVVDETFQFIGIQTYQAIGYPDKAEITLAVKNFFETGKSTYDSFKRHDEIEIRLGYNKFIERVFKGNLDNLRLHSDPDHGELLTLLCSQAEKIIAKDQDSLKPPKYKVTLGIDVFDLDLSLDAESSDSLISASVQGSIVISGTNKLDINTLLKFEGASDIRFNEDVFISGIAHKVEEGNWFTSLTVE